MVEIRDIQNEHFDWHNTWTESKLPELVRKDIWSIDIGRDSYGNEIKEEWEAESSASFLKFNVFM